MSWKSAAFFLGLLFMFCAWQAFYVGQVFLQPATFVHAFFQYITPDFAYTMMPYTTPLMGFGFMMAIGLVLGGALGKMYKMERSKNPKHPMQRIKLFIGGMCLGFGALCAGGGLMGHMFVGLSQLSVSSILFTLSVLAVAMPYAVLRLHKWEHEK